MITQVYKLAEVDPYSIAQLIARRLAHSSTVMYVSNEGFFRNIAVKVRIQDVSVVSGTPQHLAIGYAGRSTSIDFWSPRAVVTICDHEAVSVIRFEEEYSWTELTIQRLEVLD